MIGLPSQTGVKGVGRHNNNLVMDGERYGYVKSFYYLGDTIDGDGGVPRAFFHY